ncbi:unnamed protein product [Phytomonas sp. EM1]|nr:unnamed protein product [Phytomonas sp. EM1]|eukprot:CCW64672.1 unnamed protein product [Phytomonas sp. isolate EM1]
MSSYDQNPVQNRPPPSTQTTLPVESISVKGRQQSEKRISFSHPSKDTPTHIQCGKESRSLATRLSSDLSPGITAEGPGTSFLTPLRSWTCDKTTWTSGTSGLSSPGGAVDRARLPPSGLQKPSASQLDTPAPDGGAASDMGEASPDPVLLRESRGMQPLNSSPSAGMGTAFPLEEGGLEQTDAAGSLKMANEGSITPQKATKPAASTTRRMTNRLLGSRQSVARPALYELSASEDNDGRKAPSSTPSFVNELVKYHNGGDSNTAAFYKDGHAPFTRSGSLGYRISDYDSGHAMQIRAMLINAERELAEVREDSAKRGMLLESLQTALDRERASVQTLRMHYFEQMEEIRIEHEAQIRQLCEQIRILKTVSEVAMAEKAKADEEAVRRRKDMLALLEKERVEKGSIMADYREQTEALIEEQGREITALRTAMDQIKEQYNKLAAEHEVMMNARDVLEGQFEEHKAQLDRERVEGARRVREIQNRFITEKESLQEEIDRIREEQLRESAKWQSKQQELLDQLRCAQERVAAQEEGRSHTLESLRQVHRREFEVVRKELESIKEAYSKQTSEYRTDLEKAVQNEKKVSESLRQALEQMRREKEEAMADAYAQRKQLQTQHHSKILQQQAVIDALSKELSEEQRARKDAESKLEVLHLRAENLQKTTHEASCALEALQIDQRTKERTLLQEHQHAIENLEAKLRNAISDLAYSQQQVQQEALVQQRLRDELTAKSTALECIKVEQKETIKHMEAEISRMSQDYSFREEEWSKTLDQLRGSLRNLEEERLRLERTLHESDAKLKAVSEEMSVDRASLESTSKQLRDAKIIVEDLRHKQNKERELNVELLDANQRLTDELQKSKLRNDELENEVQMGLRRLEESRHEFRRQGAAHESKLNELEQRHKAELVSLNLVVEQTRMESSCARESVASKEAAIVELREELTTLRRDAALRENALQEELRDLKSEHQEGMRRMDELLNGLRSDLAKSQTMCTEYQRELNNIHRTMETRYLDLEAALEQSEAARARHQEDSKYRDQLNQELQSTVRLLTTRLCSHEEEIKRLQEEVSDTNVRVQDAHVSIGRKDSIIGQLSAKLRAYESRGFLI